LRIHRLPKRVQVEPGALEQAQVLADRRQHDQHNHRENHYQGFGAGKSTHSGSSESKQADEISRLSEFKLKGH
jgi:hypothetical protein